ncbi:MAG: prephenate/arogenate dehydrogenase family protein [Cucumibacter sp.]
MAEATPMFRKMALIGIGLIGSSLARAVKRRGLAGEIAIATRSRETLAKAKALGLGDLYGVDPAVAVDGADLVVLCTPVGAYRAIGKAIQQYLGVGTILTDVGSVKGHVQSVLAPIVPSYVHFVPGHPLAGTEHSGPDAGFAELFENRWCILTPMPTSSSAAVAKLAEFWKALGSSVEIMDARHHDLVLAITSHVPHLIAYNIVGTADELEEVTKSEVIKYSASGFRDFTRIAASDPVMWRDVFLTNREAVLEMLGRFMEDLTALQKMVRNGDGEGLEKLFTKTREVRRSIVEAGQDTAAPDFGRRGGKS